METICEAKGKQLLKKDDKFFIAEVVEDNHLLEELPKNEAMLLMIDFIRQVAYGKEDVKINYNLRGK